MSLLFKSCINKQDKFDWFFDVFLVIFLLVDEFYIQMYGKGFLCDSFIYNFQSTTNNATTVTDGYY
jgi:hypothetical protein